MASRSYTEKQPRSRFAMQTERDYELCAVRLKALADPDRLHIINILLRGEKTVSELADALDVSIVKVSHHLGVLKSAEVVQSRKQGKFVIYSLCPDVKLREQEQKGLKTIDLGCCQLDLVQPSFIKRNATATVRS